MEANLQHNFNVGFTNMKSDVLVHLTQWQYWWWFWFSLLWAFYYLVILKMVRFRSLKFRPRLATTFRPHGKWGDLIVCIIPVSWCANIITNSNFILRMIEWQSESGLLTVRIRGKQWYWVYKFELKTFTDIFTIPKNVGHNKWQIATPNDVQVADDYLHVLQLRSQNRWVKSYWEELTKEVSKSKEFNLISPQEYFSDLIERDYSYELQTNPIYIDNFNNKSYAPDFISIEREGKLFIFDRKKESAKLDFILKYTQLNPEEGSSYLDEILMDELKSILRNQPIWKELFVELVENLNEEKIMIKDKLTDTYKVFGIFENKEDLLKFFNFNSNDYNHYLWLDTDSMDANHLRIFFKILSLENSNEPLFNLHPIRLTIQLYDFLKFHFSKFITVEEELVKFNSNDNTSVLFEIFDKYWVPNILNELSDNEDTFDRVLRDSFPEGLENTTLLFSLNENFYTRLLNKKLNWEESSFSDSLDGTFKKFLENDEVFESRSEQFDLTESFYNSVDSEIESSVYKYSDFNEFDRNSRKSQGTVSPVRLIKYPISNKTNFDLSSDVLELFRFRFNDGDASTEQRITPNSAFLIIRQKRYKRRKVILPRNVFYKEKDGTQSKNIKSSNYTFLSQNSIILENDFNATKRYKFFKKSKMRDEMTNLVLSKRILRTRRTLVLPAHLNITAITNSFDVIHSWFIPGLGLKMDAVPGRATHHTFYIDNVGFYYGQCAEICGRYHHHMPIRICALPFEHFLLWWQSFGLPKLLFTKNFRRYSYTYGSRKYAW